MTGFFKPSDISTRICTVDGTTKGGSAFAICENGEKVFISTKIVDAVGVEVGDMLFAYCVDNYRDGEGYAKYSARWRAIRVEVQERFKPVAAAAPAQATQEAPQEVVYALPVVVTQGDAGARIRALLDEDRVWSARRAADRLEMSMNQASSWLWWKHKTGEIASARLFQSMDQERASHVVYAKDIEVIRRTLGVSAG
jgi:hypothetical protein